MTTYAERPTINVAPMPPSVKGKNFVKWITSTDHKVIGYMYLITTFAWFLTVSYTHLTLPTNREV